MSSIRGTTRSGSSSSRARKAPSTEPAFAALAGPVTSVKGKRSNLRSRADGKVAPESHSLTRNAKGRLTPFPIRVDKGLDHAVRRCVRQRLFVALLRQHH